MMMNDWFKWKRCRATGIHTPEPKTITTALTENRQRTHKDRTTGSSCAEVFSTCGLTAGRRVAPEAEQGFRVLVCV